MAATRRGAGRWVTLARKMGDTAVKTEAEAENYVKLAAADVILDQGATAAQVAGTLGVKVADVEAWVESVAAARGAPASEPRLSSRRPASVRQVSVPGAVAPASSRRSQTALALRLLEGERREAELAPEWPSLPPSPSWRLRDAEREERERRRAAVDRLLEEATPSEFGRVVGAVPSSARGLLRQAAPNPTTLSPITERSPVSPTTPTPRPPSARMARVEELLQRELVSQASRRAAPALLPAASSVRPPPASAPPVGRVEGRAAYLRGRQQCAANLVRETVARNGGNKSAAARQLGISRETLYANMGESPYYIARREAGRA